MKRLESQKGDWVREIAFLTTHTLTQSSGSSDGVAGTMEVEGISRYKHPKGRRASGGSSGSRRPGHQDVFTIRSSEQSSFSCMHEQRCLLSSYALG